LEHKLRSDLNGALNILKKATNSVISTVRKPFSFPVDHNRVAPVSGVTPKTSGISPFGAGKRSGFVYA